MEQANNILGQAFQGLKLQDNANLEKVASLLDKFGLRWSVNKEPLYLADGTITPFVGIVRDDTRQVFTTCKDSYNPYQNSELAELLIRISDIGGYEIHTGGMFKNGSKVYVQLKSGNVIEGIGKNNDKVIGYTTGINSHDGTTSLKWGSTNITISCQNTFNMAARELTNSLKHTNSLHNKVDIYLREVGISVAQEKTLFDKFIKLSEQKLQKHHVAKVVREVTGVDILMNQDEAKEKFGTYNLNRTDELLECISNEIEQKGETLWGLLSGVTNYTTHIMPVPKRENARMESKYVGSGSKIDNKAFNLISSLN